MNNAMRYSLSAVFTGLATSYFAGVGIARLIKTPRPLPTTIISASAPVSISLATTLSVRDDLFRPLGAPPDPNEAMWRAVKGEQTSLKSQVDNQMATMLRVEQEWRESDRKVDRVAIKMAETEKLMQETKNALEAAQIRIGKLEAGIKVAQDRELKATMTAKRMVKMFGTMTPDKAVKILQELPNEEAADLLARMKEAEAAAILALIPPKRAASISARMAGNRGGPP